MSPKPEAERTNGDLAWFVTLRREEYRGEARANLIRLIGIAGFYAIELISYYGLRVGFLEIPRQTGIDREFHVAVTALALTWTAVGLGVHFALRARVFPDVLKFVSTGADVALLTSVLVLADGPRSPLVVIYFLVLALAALRFSLPLVRFATGSSIASYLFLSGYARWFAERDLTVPRYAQFVVLLALLLAGVVLGQVLRRIRAMVREHANATTAAPRTTPTGEPKR